MTLYILNDIIQLKTKHFAIIKELTMKKIAILGYGGRGYHYAKLCQALAKEYKLTAVIDNSKAKLGLAKEKSKLNDNQLFISLDDFLSAPKTADWLFVCTQDKDHIEHAIKALKAGYNLLLEKPVACSPEDCIEIEKTSKELGLTVAVCHVLRYSVYYEKIKEIMDSGILGQIVAIDQVENVAYWHQAHSYVRGDWRRKDESNPMIIVKCCHDLDIAVYLANSKCKRVTSQGQLNFFRKENAPEGATEFCLGGCKAKKDCPYDCEKLYAEPLKKLTPKAREGIWPQSRLIADSIVTLPKLYDAMKTSRYGKCVFLSDNDVVDYQVTTMLFENGINSTLTMTAFSSPSYRETRIRGTLGELVCNMGESKIMLYVFGQKAKRIPLKPLDAHGGGDHMLIKKLAKDQLKTDISLSIESHLIGFAAEESRLTGNTIKMDEFRKQYQR